MIPTAPYDDDGEERPLPPFVKPRPNTVQRRKVEHHVSRDLTVRGSVAIFRAECETLLNEGHGLKLGDRNFVERIMTDAVQPSRHSKEQGLAVFMKATDWKEFEILRRRFVQARCFFIIRQRRRASNTSPHSTITTPES